MATVKSILDEVVLKEDSNPGSFVFVTDLHGNRIDFSDFASTLIELGVINLTGDVDPEAALALRGDMMNDHSPEEPYYEVDEATATIRWGLNLNLMPWSLESLDVSIIDVSFSATLRLYSVHGDELPETRVSVPSATKSGFNLVVSWRDEEKIPHAPNMISINYRKKRINIEF